jgi:O-antigen/teichoic acid export membrane protein
MTCEGRAVSPRVARAIRALLRRFRKDSLVRDVMMLACGTAGAQTLTIIVTPLLTRIFTPEAYGFVGLFVSIGTLLVVASTLRYDQAIPLERNDDNASQMVGLTVTWSAAVAILLFAVGGATSVLQGSTGVFDAYDVVPLAGPLALAMAVHEIAGMWAVHRERFGRIATSEVVQAFTTLSLQLAGGLFGLGAVALVGGHMIGTVIGATLLVALAWREGAFARLLEVNFRAKWQLARKHYRFPLYSTPTALLERFSKRVPVFLLAMLYSPLEAGYYWLCFRILINPGRILVRNIRKPYYKRAVDLRARGEPLTPLLVKATLVMAVAATAMAGVFGALGPQIFQLVFGAEWYRAGEYAQWLVFATAASILAVPCLELAPVLGHQGQLLVLQIIHFILRGAAILTGGMLGDDLLAIQLYSVVSVLLNLTLIGYFWIISGAAPRALGSRARL